MGRTRNRENVPGFLADCPHPDTCNVFVGGGRQYSVTEVHLNVISQLAMVQQAFNEIDKDQSGTISRDEFISTMIDEGFSADDASHLFDIIDQVCGRLCCMSCVYLLRCFSHAHAHF